MDSLLFVCTGNICRSPFMEAYFRTRLADAPQVAVQVGSAGTRAVVGAPMSAEMARSALAAGASPSGFRARQLNREMVLSADLVITADRAHRADVLELAPGAHRRLFTLRQAGRLLGQSVPASGSLAELAQVIAGRRGRHPASADDDVPDPYGGPDQGYTRAAALMVPPLDALWAAILRSTG